MTLDWTMHGLEYELNPGLITMAFGLARAGSLGQLKGA